MEGLQRFEDPGHQPGRPCAHSARRTTRRIPGCSSSAWPAGSREDLAILVYTSGTTGKPKGAMHSHAGLVYITRGYSEIFDQNENDERMAFLPLCHIVERVGGEYSGLYTGAVLNFVENPDTVPENVREIAPTVFAAVPRVWEKFYSLRDDRRCRSPAGCSRLVYGWAIGVGHRVADLVLAGQPVPAVAEGAVHAARCWRWTTCASSSASTAPGCC
jgi:long-chain acyl-CoA synthetase